MGLAGLYGSAGALSEAAVRERLVRAAGGSDAYFVRSGPLAVASTGARPAAGGGPISAVTGKPWGVPELATRLGVPPVPAEQVLAATYARWGEGVLDHLRGDFVLLAWDPERERGLLATDQLGAGALFFHDRGGVLAFATEVRDLLGLLPRRPGPDQVAVAQWLAGGAAVDDRTVYEGVRRLRGGHALMLTAGRWTRLRYWAPTWRDPSPASSEVLGASLRAELASAVARRLPDEGTAGLLLSGGLDSSSVAAMAVAGDEPRSSPVAYSAVFPRHPSIDESALIDTLVAHLGIHAVREPVVGGGVLQGSLHYMHTWEVPPVSPSISFWSPLLARAAHDGVGVMLDGEGGDELFGLAPYLLADRLRAGRLASATALAGRFPGDAGRPSWRTLGRLLGFYGVRGAVPHALHRAGRQLRGPERHAPVWMAPATARLLAESVDPWAWKAGSGPLWWRQLADALTVGRERMGAHDFLRRRAAMSGLEARHPLLDLELVDFVLGLPPELAFHSRLDRPVLRRGLRGVVPDAIRLRDRKSYFTPLFIEGLAGPDRRVIGRLLGGTQPEVASFVDIEVVRRDLIEAPPGHRVGRAAWAWQVWRLATVECWLRAQADPALPAASLCE